MTSVMHHLNTPSNRESTPREAGAEAGGEASSAEEVVEASSGEEVVGAF